MHATHYEYRLGRVGAHAGAADAFVLDPAKQVRLGRNAACDVSIADPMVSRTHALISATGDDWYVYDLKSHNGTFVNGNPIAVGTRLQPGDEVRLGPDGPAFSFERRAVAPAVVLPDRPLPPPRPRIGGRAAASPSASFHITSLLPVFAHGRVRTLKREQLVPGVVTIVTAILLVVFSESNAQAAFDCTVVVYLLFLTCSEVLRMAGRPKPWYALAGAAALTALFGTATDTFAAHASPPVAGATEELVKAAPILIGVWIGVAAQDVWKKRLGVCDALDGIVIGAGSAAGFELVHALRSFADPTVANGLQAVLPGIVGDVASHVAYSGYFGYAIGLAVATPRHRWKLFFGGWAVAATANTLLQIGSGSQNQLFVRSMLQLVIGIASFVLLIAAIGRARQVAGLSLPLDRNAPGRAIP